MAHQISLLQIVFSRLCMLAIASIDDTTTRDVDCQMKVSKCHWNQLVFDHIWMLTTIRYLYPLRFVNLLYLIDWNQLVYKNSWLIVVTSISTIYVLECIHFFTQINNEQTSVVKYSLADFFISNHLPLKYHIRSGD